MNIKGLEVVCVDNKNQEEQLTIGQKYTILGCGALGDSFYIVADDGRVWEMSKKRFIL